MLDLVNKLKLCPEFADFEQNGKIENRIKLMLGPVKDFKRAYQKVEED